MNQNLCFQYSFNTLIFWQTNQSNTSIGLLSIDSRQLRTITISGIAEIYLCEIVQDKLVVGMNACHLQVIDLITCQCEVIKKGTPKQYFQMENKEASMAIFQDGSAVIIDKEIREINVNAGDYIYTDLDGVPVLCDSHGKVFICDKEVSFLNFSCKSIQQIGVNLDTQQIFIAEKGMIKIIE